jgi:hypothetical protein
MCCGVEQQIQKTTQQQHGSPRACTAMRSTACTISQGQGNTTTAWQHICRCRCAEQLIKYSRQQWHSNPSACTVVLSNAWTMPPTCNTAVCPLVLHPQQRATPSAHSSSAAIYLVMLLCSTTGTSSANNNTAVYPSAKRTQQQHGSPSADVDVLRNRQSILYWAT